MDAIETLKTRRCMRSFKDKKIPKDIIEDIVDCARLAPTARNVQPWEFIAVTDKNKLAKIGKIAEYGPFIKDAACCIVVCCKDGKYSLEDGCNASTYVLLAAKAHKIGSCWVAGHKKGYCEEIKELLSIPEDTAIISLLPLGYHEGKIELPKKRALKEVIHWEGF
jgi:nitroreductase